MISPGVRIETTVGSLGVMEDPECKGRVAIVAAKRGTRGRYLKPHPNADLASLDWHIVAVAIDGDVYFSPVSSHHFRVIT